MRFNRLLATVLCLCTLLATATAVPEILPVSFEAEAKKKQAYVSVNWPQAVIRVRFEDGIGEEQLEMEEANEGERE